MHGTVVIPELLAASFEAPELDDPAGGTEALGVSVGFMGATLTRRVPAPGPAIPVPAGGVPEPGVPGVPPPPSSVPPPEPDPNSAPPPLPPPATIPAGIAPRSARACAACSVSASSIALGARTPPLKGSFGLSCTFVRAFGARTPRRGACCAASPTLALNANIKIRVRIWPPASLLGGHRCPHRAFASKDQKMTC